MKELKLMSRSVIQEQLTGVTLSHCGHPTALWPWQMWIRGIEEMILQPNGTAWQLKREAQAAGELILAGHLPTFRNRRGYLCCGFGEKKIFESWEFIRFVRPELHRGPLKPNPPSSILHPPSSTCVEQSIPAKTN
jgi:hypothetical protein